MRTFFKAEREKEKRIRRLVRIDPIARRVGRPRKLSLASVPKDDKRGGGRNPPRHYQPDRETPEPEEKLPLENPDPLLLPKLDPPPKELLPLPKPLELEEKLEV